MVFALVAVVLFGFIGFAIDAGYALYNSRHDQNAADFAAMRAARMLSGYCFNTPTTVSGSDIQAEVVTMMQNNAPASVDGTPSWSAVYLNSAAISMGVSPPANPPAGTCGITVNINSNWRTRISSLVGFPTLKTTETARAMLHRPGIYALAQYGLHTLLGGGGSFTVNGDFYDNSYGCTPAGPPESWPWPNAVIYGPYCASDAGGPGGKDVIDNKDASIAINGNLYSHWSDPVDGGCAITGPAGAQVARCGPYTISYDNSIVTGAINNPLASVNTTSPTLPCGSLDPATVPDSTIGLGGVDYYPGTYDYPVVISGNAKLLSCGSGIPGIYKFQQGIEICPGAGQNVTTDTIDGVTIYTQNVFSGTAAWCPWMNPVLDSWNPQGGHGGFFDFYSLYIGGSGGVTITAPSYGALKGVALMQDSAIPANYGFYTALQDGGPVANGPITSNLTIRGEVYNASLPSGWTAAEGDVGGCQQKDDGHPMGAIIAGNDYCVGGDDDSTRPDCERGTCELFTTCSFSPSGRFIPGYCPGSAGSGWGGGRDWLDGDSNDPGDTDSEAEPGMPAAFDTGCNSIAVACSAGIIHIEGSVVADAFNVDGHITWLMDPAATASTDVTLLN